MLFNKNISKTRYGFNMNGDDNDDDTVVDDDHYYFDSDQYNRFYPFSEGYHQYRHRQSNTNNNSRKKNKNNNYNSNRQNNDIRNYEYYNNYNTELKNQHYQTPSSILSISSTTAAAARVIGVPIQTNGKKIKMKKNQITPSYEHQQNPYHDIYNSSNDNSIVGNTTKTTTTTTDDINWKNDFIFNNMNPLNDAIERPTNNNHNNKRKIIKEIQKRKSIYHDQHHPHHHHHQQKQQQREQLKYEPLKPKLFGTFSFNQKKNSIDPNRIDTASSYDSGNNNKDSDDGNVNNNNTNSKNNNKQPKTLISRIKNFTSYKNLIQLPTPPPSSIRAIPRHIKLNRNYNDAEYPEIHHHTNYNNEYNNYNDDYDDDDSDNDYNSKDSYYKDIDDDDDDNDGIKGKKINIRTKIRAFIIEFLEEVSAHGFAYLAKSGLHIIERIIWIFFIAIAIFGVISLGQRIWNRFQTSPMVITMDRNKLVWNTSFPSLTVCPYKRVDDNKLEEYMENNLKFFENEEDRLIFREFVINLANASYDNIETLIINKTFGLSSNKYRDLLHDVKWNFSPEMSSGTPVKMHIYETITELGVCHAVNSMIARYNSYEYWKYNNWDPIDHGDKVTVHPLDGEIYAQIINLSTAYDVYFHGAMEVPDISKQKYTFPETDYTTVELTALEIFTAEEARDFAIKQRKCRFHYEADEMITSPIYTFGLCRTECRMKLALKICKCVPHFYRNQVRSGQILPICGIEGFACLAKIKKEIIALKSDYMNIECDCQPNCDDSNFFVQSYKSRIWFLGANLQWGISSYPKMQLRREILFTFADVLVYIGGLAGFFLGCSILSFTEFIYFFTARLIKRLIYG